METAAREQLVKGTFYVILDRAFNQFLIIILMWGCGCVGAVCGWCVCGGVCGWCVCRWVGGCVGGWVVCVWVVCVSGCVCGVCVGV